MFKEQNNLILSDTDRIKLKTEFDQLETIDQKYVFWRNRFNYDYSHYYSLEQISISDFIIIPKTLSETEEINRLLYNNYINSYGNRSDESPENWKESFHNSITSSINKENLVEYELKKIDDLINRLRQSQLINNGIFRNRIIQPKSEWFFSGYEEYLINQKEFDWTEKLYHPKSIIDILLGIEWAKYREFIKNFLNPKKKQIDIKLSGEQKFLILHYLKFGNELNTDTEKSILYEFFIDELKLKSIQRLFPNITDYETEKNLDTLIDFFRLIKLNSKARELENKLAKLKQKPQR
jgi:hypothetical protein